MAAREFQLVGGPLDGRRIILRRRPAFLWVDDRPGGACYLAPKHHRVLYRRCTWREGLARTRDGYVYAELTHALCGGCGAFSERADGHVVDCSLCGSKLLLPEVSSR